MIFQQKILPPIPFLIAENLNEISGLSIGEITLILCYFILNIVWFVASTFNGNSVFNTLIILSCCF